MSRLIVPIQGRFLYATGDVLRRAELDILIKTNSGNWVQEQFLVDSGTEMTTFSTALAKALDLPIPINAVKGAIHAQTGLEIRSGVLLFQVVGMDQTEYAIDCLFLGDPNATGGGPVATLPRKLFQPLGILQRLRFTFDDNQSLGSPYGEMIVEKK